MPKIIQLSPHIANLIAAGEVVERPASVVKELLENAVDAGATKITVELQGGGMTFLRITDNGCGMHAEDAPVAFQRHATSKLRAAEDLAAISTMGFRGEALAAIASVSRIDLLTKPADTLSGTSLHLEAGKITEQSEAGCPDGTTIIIRDLFYNTPARMKFMKSDSVEASRITAAVQLQALAHPECAITLIRDGKQVLCTPGNGGLQAAVYSVYGRECADMTPVHSVWEKYTITGYVSKPTQARPSRSLQTFFVNHRPVKSRLLVTALEEAYRNQLMAGKFPGCVLCLELPPSAVDVNVHPAKTEVKFLNEKAVFDCVHYGVLAALNKTVDRPPVQFRQPAPPPPAEPAKAAPKKDFFRTMTPEEFKTFSAAVAQAPKPEPAAAAAAAARIPPAQPVLRQNVVVPKPAEPVRKPTETPPPPPEPVQTALEMPPVRPWRLVGELYRSYILVEQGDEAFLIDKHAAHERILFEKLKANQEAISAQTLLAPIPVRLNPTAAAELLTHGELLEALGFEIQEFGENTVLLRQVPMDLSTEDAAETLEALGADLLAGKAAAPDTVRDQLLHTVACKAAIKAGWKNDEAELLAVAQQVMSREELKYCPHGRPLCISLSRKQLERQFKRS